MVVDPHKPKAGKDRPYVVFYYDAWNISEGIIVGISLAIVASVVISIALNLQKYAHNRLKDFEDQNYLKSKIWWLGMILLVSGEFGNFIAYGFAPATIVAPLGAMTIVANVVIAHVFLKELLRVRDLFDSKEYSKVDKDGSDSEELLLGEKKNGDIKKYVGGEVLTYCQPEVEEEEADKFIPKSDVHKPHPIQPYTKPSSSAAITRGIVPTKEKN
ncbi:uncharacterized protein TRIADDRAFT_57906 [Trichoplax adhaerens]|uniref:Uncharacterized protein n=1 Tax=Trichoplax adhaerens TaxID=10228 RepID=B3S230_TRIAD|nr:hypothetical protein TRIADDRAFT_57906 [Trichoplax adhaerens]EDV23042.1 hypothetical protein TRIADDRAFT_57906 [Trichoplax adhaerens]|eukprot:XP_002113952.1 hypothetical protein TRIADDRAFT_57906 [Trichoplax adhaerens]